MTYEDDLNDIQERMKPIKESIEKLKLELGINVSKDQLKLELEETQS